MDKLGKLSQLHYSDPLERKINKIAKFEIDLLKTNEDIASQSCEILQTWGDNKLVPHHTNVRTSANFATFRNYIFARLRLISFKLGNF